MRRYVFALLFACSLAGPVLAQSPCIIPPFIPEQHEFSREEVRQPDAELWLEIDLTRKPNQAETPQEAQTPEAQEE
ncbi:MAG: hypothetical protein KC910_04770 [Candidatus Eremiobacteraeota bacterium]|nr:hypothetical protein [Candidatus Eremiobacteraeota bacterium]